MNHLQVTKTLIALCIITLSSGCGIKHFRQEMDDASKRIDGTSKVVKLSNGELEYIRQGRGIPLLVIHGAGGGFDQGLACAKILGDGYEFISVSRFGYLKTPMPENASVSLQADMYAELLDTLGIDKIAILGISGGGPSSIDFSIRHSNRCSGLILLSAVSLTDEVPPVTLPLRIMLKSDYRHWRLTKNRVKMCRIMGTPDEVTKNMTQEEIEIVDGLLKSMYPIMKRFYGMVSENRVFSTAKSLAIANITMPVLVFHSNDDKLINIKHSYNVIQKLPTAKFIEFKSGGHLNVGNYGAIRRLVNDFVSHI
jgi:pimeloyl-ACP methyl ester carboxylesterase